MFKNTAKILMLGSVIISTNTSLATDTQYRVIPIPLPDGATTINALGLNNSNEVTGAAIINSEQRPYLYTDGQSMFLDDVPGIYTTGNAVNDTSHVTGWMYEWGIIWPQAFLWDGIQNHPLQDPDDSNSYGQGINDYDQVVGCYYPSGGHANGNAFVCTGGQYYNLGSGQATDINNSGMAVGQINRYFGDTAVWEPDGNGGWTRTVLDGQLATAINETGTVFVGSGPLITYFDSAALWTRDGEQWLRTDIGKWDPDVTNSIANDVNDCLQVVGDYQSFVDSDRGWLYQNDTVYWLTDMLVAENNDWEVTRAIQINESGVILADASQNGSNASPVLLLPDNLTILGPRPGVAGQTNEFITISANTGNRVFFIYGFAAGSKQVPHCPGVTVGINAPVIFGSAVADVNQEARLSLFIPNAAAGRMVYLQSVEPATCSVSNVLKYQVR